MDELNQWCEIYGHFWISTYFSYGLILGPKIVHMFRVCDYCKKDESSIYKPNENYKMLPYLGVIL